MGVWLMGSVSMAIVATQNFWTVYRLVEAKPNVVFATDIDKFGRDEVFSLLYYFSSELNRLYFQYWNLAQLAIGILTLWLVVKDAKAYKAKWTIVAMLGIVLFLTALITPRMVSVGRDLDFVPRVPQPPGLRTFGLLHATYTVFYGIELILGVLATLWIVKQPTDKLADSAHEAFYRADQKREHYG
jgi:hypothetical protein